MAWRKAGAGSYVAGVAAILLAGAVGYSVFGARHDAPAPAPTAAASAPTSIEALQQRVRAAPGDADGWAALGAALFAAERYGDAAGAYARGVAVAPGRGDLWSALGEARVLDSPRDPMPAAALDAFRKAVAIDPKDPRARYFLAVSRDLSGDHAGAIGDWLALLGDTPAGAPWEADLRRTIEQVGKINRIDVAARLAAAAPKGAHPGLGNSGAGGAGPLLPGPTQEQVRAAGALPPGEQDQMARGMVASLEAKLRADPANVDGWLMLMRSRVTLGERDKAVAALKAAVAANPGAAGRLKGEAAGMGVE